MTEKKAATKKVVTSKAETSKKTAAKKNEVVINAESAGDVYQALAAAEKPMSVAEIAKAAKISKEEAYLGIGWLFKEGKVKDEDSLIALA